MNASPRLPAGPVLVDGHVHFHACFSEQLFFEAAASNFARAARQLRIEPALPGLLLFTEAHGARYFEQFRDRPSSPTVPGRWTLRRTAEPTSLIVARDGRDTLVLVSGRQIATGEGLEVLALNTTRQFADGRSLADTLHTVWDAGTTAVVPWGFGKWWLGRGRLVRETLERLDGEPLLLGDNGGRPRWTPEPALLRLARRRGVGVLPGSDPLPFPSQTAKAGRYGACFTALPDPERPAASVMESLHATATPLTFGRLETLSRFCGLQLALQWRKRRGATPR